MARPLGRDSRAGEVAAGFALLFLVYGLGSLAFRLAIITDYTLNLGWDDFIGDIATSAALIAAGFALLVFSRSKRGSVDGDLDRRARPQAVGVHSPD